MAHPCGHAACVAKWAAGMVCCAALVLGALAPLLISASSLEGMKSSVSLASSSAFENTPVPCGALGAAGADTG